VVAKSETEFARYFKLAADQNHASASLNYAFCLAKGRDVPKNEAEAARCYKPAANQNDPDPKYDYAVCLALRCGDAVIHCDMIMHGKQIFECRRDDNVTL
jgi:TPR repeat protein